MFSVLVSGEVYKYTCGRCNSSYFGETDRHLKVRSGEDIGISPLTYKVGLSASKKKFFYLFQW